MAESYPAKAGLKSGIEYYKSGSFICCSHQNIKLETTNNDNDMSQSHAA